MSSLEGLFPSSTESSSLEGLFSTSEPLIHGPSTSFAKEKDLRDLANSGPDYVAESTPEQERIWAERDMRQWEEAYNNPKLNDAQRAVLLEHKPKPYQASLEGLFADDSAQSLEGLFPESKKGPGYSKAGIAGLDAVGAALNRTLAAVPQVLPFIPQEYADKASGFFHSQAQELDKSALTPEEQASMGFPEKLAMAGGTIVGMAPGLVGGLPGGAAVAAAVAFGNKAQEVEQGLSDKAMYITTPINVMIDAAAGLLPIFGSTIGKAAVIGAIVNPATSALSDAVNKAVMTHTGDEAFAVKYDPWDVEQRAIEALIGAPFSAIGKYVDIKQNRFTPAQTEEIMDKITSKMANELDFVNKNIKNYDFEIYTDFKSVGDNVPWKLLTTDVTNGYLDNINGTQTPLAGREKFQVLLDYVIKHGETENQKNQAVFLQSILEFVTKDNDNVVALAKEGNRVGNWDFLARELGLYLEKSTPKTFIHEMAHVLSSQMFEQFGGYLYPTRKRVANTPEEQRMFDVIKDFEEFYTAFKDPLMEIARKENLVSPVLDVRKKYGLTDPHEFFAEMLTSQVFRDQLEKIKLSPEQRKRWNTRYQGNVANKFVLDGRKLSDYKDKSLLDLGLFKVANIMNDMVSGHSMGIGGKIDLDRHLKAWFGTGEDVEKLAGRFGMSKIENQISEVAMRKIGQFLAMYEDPDQAYVRILSLFNNKEWKAMITERLPTIVKNRAKFTQLWADFAHSEAGKLQVSQDMRTTTKIVDDLFKTFAKATDDMSSTGTEIFGADQLSMIKDNTKGGLLVKAFNDKVNEYRRFKKQLYHDFLSFQQKFTELSFKDKIETMMEARFWDTLSGRKTLETMGLQWPTREMLQTRGISEKVIDAYLELTKGYDYIWKTLSAAGKTVKELNVDKPFELVRIPGFMPHFHDGNVKVRLRINNDIIMLSRNTIWGANRLVKKITKLNDPNIQIEPDPHTGKAYTVRQDRSPALSISTALIDNYNSYKNWAKLDPILGDKIATLDIDDSRGYVKTFLKRKNVGGYLNSTSGGIEPKEMRSYFGIPNKAADDVFGIFERYARGTSDFIGNAMFVNDVTRPLLSPATEDYPLGRAEKLQKLPNTMKYIEAQGRNFTGENLNHLPWIDEKLQQLGVGLRLHPHFFKFLNRGVRGFLSMVKLRTVRNWIANIQQPMNGLGMLYHFAISSGLEPVNGKSNPMESIGWAYTQLLMRDTAEGRLVMKWALDNHIVEAHQTFERHADMKIESPFWNKIDKWLLGGVNERIERFSRMATFLMSYHYMKQFYGNTANALEAADRATRAIMVNYDPAARPHMYQNYGITGEFLSPFAVYRNAYLGNTLLMLRDIKRNPTRLENWKPFLVGQAVYLMMAGVIGMIGIAEYDFIAQQWNENMPDDTMKLPTSSEWTYALPDWLSFGVLSAASTNIPGLENGFYAGTSATAPNITNLTSPPLLPFIQALIAFGAIPVKEGLALITDNPGASSDDMYKALKQIMPPHFFPALDQFMNETALTGLRANSLEGMIDREQADINALAATGAQSLREHRERRVLEKDQKKQMTMRSFVKKYANKVVDKMLGAPLGMDIQSAFAKAKEVDPTLEFDDFSAQVEEERISRITSKNTRTKIRGSTTESIDRQKRLERYGY